jgi:UPF0755 protein
MKKIIAAVMLIAAAAAAFLLYQYAFAPNIITQKKISLYIPTGSNFKNVLDTLNKYKLLKDQKSFETVAKQMKYIQNVKPGRYVINKNMSNRQLLSKLMAGEQDPLNFSFVKFRKMEEMAKSIGKKLEADSTDFVQLLHNNDYLNQFGLDSLTVSGMFIPNTYEMYWTTKPKDFMQKMYKEYTKFWNQTRMQQLKALNLTQNQALTLASIVEEETNQNDEKTRIAGVYLNRIKANMPLQADPTVKFALNDFAIKRITTEMTLYASPYNTYSVQGLPPSPICTPSVASIDAVLHAETHDYLYFCASEDFSGHHNFATTYAQHLLNARRYQQALNQNRIY